MKKYVLFSLSLCTSASATHYFDFSETSEFEIASKLTRRPSSVRFYSMDRAEIPLYVDKVKISVVHKESQEELMFSFKSFNFDSLIQYSENEFPKVYNKITTEAAKEKPQALIRRKAFRRCTI